MIQRIAFIKSQKEYSLITDQNLFNMKVEVMKNQVTIQELKHKINKILLNLEIPKIKIMKT